MLALGSGDPTNAGGARHTNGATVSTRCHHHFRVVPVAVLHRNVRIFLATRLRCAVADVTEDHLVVLFGERCEVDQVTAFADDRPPRFDELTLAQSGARLVEDPDQDLSRRVAMNGALPHIVTDVLVCFDGEVDNVTLEAFLEPTKV